ncbi:unnamed protein product [Ixodes pacificus]
MVNSHTYKTLRLGGKKQRKRTMGNRTASQRCVLRCRCFVPLFLFFFFSCHAVLQVLRYIVGDCIPVFKNL